MDGRDVSSGVVHAPRHVTLPGNATLKHVGATIHN
jgi:hypothetical protein